MNASSAGDASSSPSFWRDRGLFLRSWLRAPGLTGSAIPSSSVTAREMAKLLDPHQPQVVAELGPGTGPITAAMQERMHADSTHIAVELNAEMARRIAELYPNVDVVNESATELPRLLTDRGIRKLDAVLSGLPFTSFPLHVQTEILDGIVGVMSDEAVFATVRLIGSAVWPSAKRFQADLEQRFAEVDCTQLVLRNLPPLYIMTARRPRR